MRVVVKDDYYNSECYTEEQVRSLKAAPDSAVTVTDRGIRVTNYKELPEIIFRDDFPERFEDDDTVILMVDRVQFHQKPTGIECGLITSRMKKEACIHRMTVDEVVKAINRGQTLCFGIRDKLDSMSESNLKYQQLFCVDIDNDSRIYSVDEKTGKDKSTEKVLRESYLDLDAIWDRCNDYSISPLIIYETFSHKADFPRYRVIFAAYKPLDPTEAAKVREALSVIFPDADTSCKDGMRRFYGGHVVYSGTFTILTEYLTRYKQPTEEKPQEKLTAHTEHTFTINFDIIGKKSANSYRSPYNLNHEIDTFDFKQYLRTNYGYYGIRDICPLCSHEHGCFRLYNDGKSWACFSDAYSRKAGKNAVGGNIINFLMLKENLTKKDAVDRFLYEIKGLKRFEVKF